MHDTATPRGLPFEKRRGEIRDVHQETPEKLLLPEVCSPRQHLTLAERAKLRDPAKDAKDLEQRLKEGRKIERQQWHNWEKRLQDMEEKKVRDNIVGRQNQRLTQMRLSLRKELLEKVS